MANKVVYAELHTGDTEKAKAFYGGLFDWNFQETPGDGPPYTFIQMGEEGGGGLTSMPTQANPQPHWLPYIGVDDLDASTAKARELGAKINEENVPVPGFGRFTIVTDPTGAEIALWEQANG